MKWYHYFYAVGMAAAMFFLGFVYIKAALQIFGGEKHLLVFPLGLAAIVAHLTGAFVLRTVIDAWRGQ